MRAARLRTASAHDSRAGDCPCPGHPLDSRAAVSAADLRLWVGICPAYSPVHEIAEARDRSAIGTPHGADQPMLV